jgi:hypothetical protein
LEKENSNSVIEFIDNREKLQEAIESQLRSKEIDNEQFKALMIAYGKKYSHFDQRQIEELIDLKIEAPQIMKSIDDIKHRIYYLDLKETYLDSFLSIGKFDQGATLTKVKYVIMIKIILLFLFFILFFFLFYFFFLFFIFSFLYVYI